MTERDNPTYAHLLGSIKNAVSTAQQQSSKAVNSRLLFAYFQVGYLILREQANQDWSAKFTLIDKKLSVQDIGKYKMLNVFYSD